MHAETASNALSCGSVVITGSGWVTPFAAGTIEEVINVLPKDQQSVRDADSTHQPVPDEILQNVPRLPEEARREMPVHIAAAALQIALHSAALEVRQVGPERVGLAIGCALAGQVGMIEFAEDVRAQSPRFVSPIRFPQTVGNYPAGALARLFGLRGPSVTLACGTASALAAIREAVSWLQDGAADAVIAGGIEIFTKALATGLAGALPSNERSFADAACLFVFERDDTAARRGARALARVDLAGVETLDIPCIFSAGVSFPSAQLIEGRAGQSLAASGAAAVAAAIHAMVKGAATAHCHAAVIVGDDLESRAAPLHLRR